MLKNQITVSLCLLVNGIKGFPCHPHNQCVSYLDRFYITNQFSIFCNNVYKLQPTKLVHVELCSTLSPYADIHGLHGDYLLSGPEDL